MKSLLFSYAQLNLEKVFEDFYANMLSSPDLSVFFENDGQIRSLIAKQQEFLLETIRLKDEDIRFRYIELGEVHHKLKVPFADFSAAIDILEHGIIQAIVEGEPCPKEILDHTFHFFKMIKAYAAKGYLNLILAADMEDIDNYLANVKKSHEIDILLATERVIWLKSVIFAIKVENRSAAPSLKTPPEILGIIESATKENAGLKNYAIEITSRIELTARNIFFFIDKQSYEEVLPLYRELMSIYKLTLMLTNIVTIASTNTLMQSLKKDQLTSLLTRHSLTTLLEREKSIAESGGYSIALVMFDIDFFKSINDQYGHVVGDHVLEGIAEIASTSIRSTDYAFRIGGEEFLLVLKGASLQVATAQAEVIRHLIDANEFSGNGNGRFKVTASFGVAVFCPPFESNVEKMLDVVDKKLYEAKQSGRNKVIE